MIFFVKNFELLTSSSSFNQQLGERGGGTLMAQKLSLSHWNALIIVSKIAIEGVLCFADVCMLFVINHEHFHLTFYKPFIILLLRCTCTTLFNISKLKTTTFSSCVIFFYCFRINACNKNLFLFLSHNKHLWIYLDVGGPNLIQNCIYSTYGPQNAKKKKPHKKQRTKKTPI